METPSEYALTLAMERVLEEIRDERFRQRSAHGWSADRDDAHPLPSWAWLLSRRSVDIAHPQAGGPTDIIDVRRTLVEIAAIAVAAIESLDRQPQPEQQEGPSS